ncbi:hypothetical protein [Falsiroseomonas stagni]|uniref:Uncharacterized protein n=1 Tax=Falsiroseomonas stagni DSM 19981 TaxID=1123062 RepID=A0A1I4BT44_9PROT|nr:hypothetical protein [Falsiroseomonas stagni]SFK71156.1 hypothetical protein SAMN02745775_10654 [Falsiroseomonas stagni DSM 19981]
MVSVAILDQAGTAGPPAPREADTAIRPVTLRVSGAKPVRLRGRLLTGGHSRATGCIAWHEVEVWQIAGSREVAVALRTHRPDGDAADVHRAELFPDLAEALDWLEAFDPLADLSVDFDASDRRLSGVEVALRAAALRGRAEVVTREWRALLGEVLFVLDADTPA